MRSLKALFIVGVLLMPRGLASAAIEPDAKVLRIDSATNVRLCMSCAQQQVRLAVTVLAAAPPTLKITNDDRPRILGISTGGAAIADLESRFQAAWEPPEGIPQYLVLTITSIPRAPATYTVLLNLLPKAWPKAPPEKIELVTSPSTLQGPEKLFVTRTHWLFNVADTTMTPLVVSETGRITGIVALSLQSMPFVHDNEYAAGEIVVDEARLKTQTAQQRQKQQEEQGQNKKDADKNALELQIESGKPATIPYRMSGVFPLGLSTGQIRLVADEMAAALAIPVEVRSELGWTYLLGAILIGLALSWWVKVILQERLQLGKARAAAATLQTNVLRELSTFPDADFQNALKEPIGVLDTKFRIKDAKAIDDARTALDSAWKTARQALETKRAGFRTRLDAWQKLMSIKWDLPPILVPVLTDARAAATPAAALDRRGDVRGAIDSLHGAERGAVIGLHAKGRSWQQASRAFFDALFAAQAGVSDAILQPLKGVSDSWRATYGALEPVPPSDIATALEPLLRQITGEYVTARDHLRDLPHHLRREFAKVADELKTNGTLVDLIAEIDKRLEALEATLTAAVDEPGAAEERLLAVLDALQDAWAAAFAAATTSEPKQVGDKVKQRDFRGAADLLGGAPILATSAARGSTEVDRFAVPFALVPRAPGGDVVLDPLHPADPYAALLLDANGDILRAKALQTVIIGGMFIAWAMSTSTGTFDGTIRGLLGAMFSAFSLDVGVDALLGKIKGSLLG